MDTNPKTVVTRFYDATNARELGTLDGLCAPNFQGHAGAGSNLIQLKMSLESFFQAFPDLRTEVRYLIAEDDLVSAWVTYEGTHQDSFAGVPGTGRSISIAGWDLFRVVDGKVAELTQFCDLFTLMNQIGALPTTAPA